MCCPFPLPRAPPPICFNFLCTVSFVWYILFYFFPFYFFAFTPAGNTCLAMEENSINIAGESCLSAYLLIRGTFLPLQHAPG